MYEDNSAYSEIALSSFDEGRVRAAAEAAREQLGGSADCIYVFVSPDWAERISDVAEVLQVYARSPIVVGCSGWGLIGTGQEDENASGFSLVALRLPHTEIKVTSFSQEDVEREVGNGWDLAARTGVEAGKSSGWVYLGNPFAMDHESLLRGFNTCYQGEPVFGGLASGQPGQTDAFLLDATGGIDAGALAVSFVGGVRVGGLVSQGCRPVGEPYTVTGADANVLYTIGSRGAFQVLEETFEALSEDEQSVARHNMLVGLAMNEYREELQTGDFLVRNILGGDPDAGALAVGARPRVGQTLQFQVRDAEAADEELRELCEAQIVKHGEPFGGLLFSCAGRGSQLFGVPNHDAGVVEDVFGKVPIAGFFCNGEVGPVGDTNFVHGYTASTALFYHA